MVLDPKERKKYAFMQALGTIRNEKKEIRHQAQVVRTAKKRKADAVIDAKFADVKKADRRSHFREAGKEQKSRARAAAGRGAKDDARGV